jgi:inner membrane protein
MDNATHAFAGLLLADATVSWIERRTGVPVDSRTHRVVMALGVLAAELPDADLVYSGPVVGLGKLGYLLHHRGHTHTIVFALFAAAVSWWVANALLSRTRDSAHPNRQLPLFVLAVAGTLSHLVLDFTNSYGVHPFWPLNNQWFNGDAVFIVEPWLWVVAIPPLVFHRRRWWSKAVLATLMALILVAAWTLGEVVQPLAIALLVFAVAWLLLQYVLPRPYRVRSALIAWCAVELVFGVSSARARTYVNTAMNTPVGAEERIVDIVLSPEAANPFCFSTIVVSISDSAYYVRTATVAPWTTQQSGEPNRSTLCRAGRGRTRMSELPGAVSLAAVQQPNVRWGEQWTAPREELVALSQTRCEFAAALRFQRVPVWTTDTNGTVHVSDLRFGVGHTGFSDVTVPLGPCPLAPSAWIPPWVPPRAESLSPR